MSQDLLERMALEKERAERSAQAPVGPVAPTDKPRVLSIDEFQFNFRIGTGQRIAARMGAPAFAQRRLRLDRSTELFWSRLETRREQLLNAAADGRVDAEGRESRQALLDADGRDRDARRLEFRRLYKERKDADNESKEAFNRAWLRHLDHCGIAALTEQIADYNHYFPIEANLPVEPTTGAFIWMGVAWEEIVAPTRETVLERFPLL